MYFFILPLLGEGIMQKTDIEWVKNPDGTQGYSWNPIKGPCPQECKLPDGRIYCYGHNLNRRFWHYKKPFFKEEEWRMVYDPKHLGIGIFVCSIFDLFHPITKTHIFGSNKITWRSLVLGAIEDLPQHRFYILTKFPQNIDRPMPGNVWLGVTVTKDEDIWRRNRLVTTDAKVKFISFEPLLGKIDMKYGLLQRINWVIIGRLTGYGKKYDPTKRQLSKMRWDIRGNSLGCSPPIFMKDNLKEIWGEKLIQEMPK